MLEKILKIFVGDKHEREIKKTMPVVEEINRIYESLKNLTDDDLQQRSLALKEKISSIEDPEEQEKACDEALPEPPPRVLVASGKLRAGDAG